MRHAQQFRIFSCRAVAVGRISAFLHLQLSTATYTYLHQKPCTRGHSLVVCFHILLHLSTSFHLFFSCAPKVRSSRLHLDHNPNRNLNRIDRVLWLPFRRFAEIDGIIERPPSISPAFQGLSRDFKRFQETTFTPRTTGPEAHGRLR